MLGLRSVPLSLIAPILLFSTAATADGTCNMICPANMNLATAPGGSVVVVNYAVTTTGTCGGFFQTAGLPTPASFPIGTTTNVFQAVDPPNQTCSFSATVTATPALPTSIPTLSEWGMVALSSLLALGTFIAFQRRRP